jgi:hypothetical protein
MAMPRTTIGGGGFSVLEDPTGRRARWMRRGGRVVFIVFLGWLLALVLGGLGLVPIGGIPLSDSLRPSTGPAPLTKLPQPRQPSVSDLRPAKPAGFVAAAIPASGRAPSSPVKQAGRSATAPGQTKTTTTASRGRSTTAPGKTKTTATTTTTTVSHGRSSSAPGKKTH